MPLDPFGHISGASARAAAQAYETLYARHPEWDEKWGEHGRFHTRQDIGFHAMFLEAAQQIDLPSVYHEYVRWCAQVLEARGVGVPLLIETLRVFADACRDEGVDAALVDDAASGLEADGPGPIPTSDPRAGELADALIGADSARAEELLAGHDAPDEQQLMAAMIHVGERWARNEISVADEHMATATCQVILAQLRARIGDPTGGRSVVLACVVGNDHDLGLRALSNFCEANGMTTHLLGADVPIDALVSYCKQHAPDDLVLSVALPQHIPVARMEIEQIRSSLSRPPRILVGGNALAGAPDLWRIVGADGGGTDMVTLTSAAP